MFAFGGIFRVFLGDVLLKMKPSLVQFITVAGQDTHNNLSGATRKAWEACVLGVLYSGLFQVSSGRIQIKVERWIGANATVTNYWHWRDGVQSTGVNLGFLWSQGEDPEGPDHDSNLVQGSGPKELVRGTQPCRWLAGICITSA